MSGTKTAISKSWTARAGTEKPVVKVETQIANTINDNVSDRTVAPIVTMTGSSWIAPSRRMIDRPSRVWDARSDPMTIAGMMAYPKASPKRVPRNNGTAVVTRPKMIERF